MALVQKTTRDASGEEFVLLFDDGGNPEGPLTPVSFVLGTTDMRIVEPVEATFTDYVGLTDTQLRATPVGVVDGTAAFVFTPVSNTSTGSAIALLGADANRKAFQFQNASDTDFTVNFDGTASASAGFLVAPGKLLEFYGPACPKGAISIFCGASAKRYVARWA